MAGRIAYLGNISAQGLVLDLDAAIQGSYPKTGTLWTDISGNNNNGTLTNGPTYTGSDYGAIVFDGVNDFINISSSDTINFGTSNFTSNLWIYPFSASLVGNTEYGVINKNGGFQNSPGWGLELSTYLATAPYPKVYLEGFNSGQTSWGNSNVDGYINTQTWSNINLIRTGTRFDVYINGSPASSKINSNIGLNIDNTTSLTLGKNGSWQSSFKGNISDFSLYNQALTQFQVWQNFNAYKSRYGIPDIVTDGLVLNLDAGNPYSYLSGSSGTTWTNTVAVSSSISGTLVNGPVYSNGAITFDGVDDYVSTSTNSTLTQAGNTQFTAEFWIKKTASNKDSMIGAWNNSDRKGWFLQWYSDSIIYFGITDGSYNYNYINQAYQNQWFHIAGVFNGNESTNQTKAKIYVNGVLLTTNNNNNILTSVPSSIVELTIGKLTNYSSFTTGDIPAVKIYNRALTQTEITQNFNALRGRYGI